MMSSLYQKITSDFSHRACVFQWVYSFEIHRIHSGALKTTENSHGLNPQSHGGGWFKGFFRFNFRIGARIFQASDILVYQGVEFVKTHYPIASMYGKQTYIDHEKQSKCR